MKALALTLALAFAFVGCTDAHRGTDPDYQQTPDVNEDATDNDGVEEGVLDAYDEPVVDDDLVTTEEPDADLSDPRDEAALEEEAEILEQDGTIELDEQL